MEIADYWWVKMHRPQISDINDHVHVFENSKLINLVTAFEQMQRDMLALMKYMDDMYCTYHETGQLTPKQVEGLRLSSQLYRNMKQDIDAA